MFVECACVSVVHIAAESVHWFIELSQTFLRHDIQHHALRQQRQRPINLWVLAETSILQRLDMVALDRSLWSLLTFDNVQRRGGNLWLGRRFTCTSRRCRNDAAVVLEALRSMERRDRRNTVDDVDRLGDWVCCVLSESLKKTWWSTAHFHRCLQALSFVRRNTNVWTCSRP